MHLQRTGRYLEFRESYRHAVTGKPTSRCVARWPLDRELEDEIVLVYLAWRALITEATERGWTKARTRRKAQLAKRFAGLREAREGLKRSDLLLRLCLKKHGQALSQDRYQSYALRSDANGILQLAEPAEYPFTGRRVALVLQAVLLPPPSVPT